MVMIGRKRITWLGGMVLLAMLCFTFQSAKLEENAVAVPTVALPVTNRSEEHTSELQSQR